MEQAKRVLTATTVLVVLGCCVLAGGNAQAQGRSNQQTLIRPRAATLLSGGGCTVGLLNLRITTGKDDLRGGNDNLDVEVHFANGDMQTATNVNKGANWPNHSVNMVGIHLNHAVAPSQIRQIRLVHSAQGGYKIPSAAKIGETAIPVIGPALSQINTTEGIQTEDNWDMAQLQAFGLGNGTNVPIASFGFHRFTGSNPSLDINAQPGAACPEANQVTQITLTLWTADDDLCGGNDNLNVTIHFADGTSQAEANVNHSKNWPNGSTRGADILLNRPVTIDQIRGITLATTFIGGPGGNNWKMASMQADAFLADGTYHTIAKSGFHRFSADWSGPSAREITIRTQPIN